MHLFQWMLPAAWCGLSPLRNHVGALQSNSSPFLVAPYELNSAEPTTPHEPLVLIKRRPISPRQIDQAPTTITLTVINTVFQSAPTIPSAVPATPLPTSPVDDGPPSLTTASSSLVAVGLTPSSLISIPEVTPTSSSAVLSTSRPTTTNTLFSSVSLPTSRPPNALGNSLTTSPSLNTATSSPQDLGPSADEVNTHLRRIAIPALILSIIVTIALSFICFWIIYPHIKRTNEDQIKKMDNNKNLEEYSTSAKIFTPNNITDQMNYQKNLAKKHKQRIYQSKKKDFDNPIDDHQGELINSSSSFDPKLWLPQTMAGQGLKRPNA